MFNWENLLLHNGIANNLLNISCLLVDTGLVSSLLWVFEIRELFSECNERILGARFHIGLSALVNSIGILNNNIQEELNYVISTSVDLLLLSGISIRNSRIRLSNVLIIKWYSTWIESISGPCSESSGFILFEIFESLFSSIVSSWISFGGIISDSIIRHILRCRQILSWSVINISSKSLD